MSRLFETKSFELEEAVSTVFMSRSASSTCLRYQSADALRGAAHEGNVPSSNDETDNVKRALRGADLDATSSQLDDFRREEDREEKHPRPTGILVIEDNQLLRTAFGQGFRNRGFDLWMAANGADGVDLYRQFWPLIDVVLSDVQMPVMDGPEAFKALRSVNPSIRFCFMTGDTCLTVRAKLLKLGAMRVYEKPLPSVANVAQELWELATSPCDSITFRGDEGMDATDPSGSVEETHIRDIRVKADLFQRICAPLLTSISELTRRLANRDF